MNDDKPLNNHEKPHYYGKQDGVHLFHARDDSHRHLVGHHVEHPSDAELEEAIRAAKDKKLQSVVIHGSPPPSLSMHLHSDLGAIKKSEELSKGEQYWFDLKNHKPSMKSGNYATWELSKEQLGEIISNPSKHHVHALSHRDSKNEVAGATHSTSIRRRAGKDGRSAASTPLSDYTSKNGAGSGKDICYHGVGQDYTGAELLSAGGQHQFENREIENPRTGKKETLPFKNRIVGGKNRVTMHDPFHHDPAITKEPASDKKFDEVHSHYTLNVTDKQQTIDLLKKYHSMLKPGGKAVISVRRDKAIQKPSDADASRLAASEIAAMARSALAKAQIHDELLALRNKIRTILGDKDLDSDFDDKHPAFDETSEDEAEEKREFERAGPEKRERMKFEELNELEEQIKGVYDEVRGEQKHSISARDIIPGMLHPETHCDACDNPSEGCICFTGLPRPRVEFDGRKVTIFFKSEFWSDESQESFIEDFKHRAGRLLRKKF